MEYLLACVFLKEQMHYPEFFLFLAFSNDLHLLTSFLDCYSLHKLFQNRKVIKLCHLIKDILIKVEHELKN